MEQKKYGRYYLESYKKEIVKEIENEGGAIKMVCDHHGLPPTTVEKWLRIYGSSDYLSRRKRIRSASEKQQILREIISGRLTVKEAQLKYRIVNKHTITGWIHAYKKSVDAVDLHQASNIVNPLIETRPVDLEKELELARLKIRALEIMVDIASEQFNVNIRKKFGAKQ